MSGNVCCLAVGLCNLKVYNVHEILQQSKKPKTLLHVTEVHSMP